MLVDKSNRFLLRYPVQGLSIEDPEAVEEVQFNDPAARVDAADFTRAKVRELEEYYLATRVVSVWNARVMMSSIKLTWSA